MIKCVIFDCDGTLVDSEYLGSQALAIKLLDYNITAEAVKLTDENRGAKFVDVLKRLEREYKVKFADNFVTEYRTFVLEQFKLHLQAFEGVASALSQIELTMCVASNAPTEQLHLALSTTSLKEYFNGNIYSAYEVNSWKPDPELFLYAADKMGFNPSECIVIEDSPVGISAANAAGMQSVLFDPQGLYCALPSSYKIEHMSALAPLLNGLS
ncbi:MAG: HAD family hydrolase [Oceanospirillaceae bacterium]|nr:HAD family hydrolase [Oceanospirillaceae bacterium]